MVLLVSSAWTAPPRDDGTAWRPMERRGRATRSLRHAGGHEHGTDGCHNKGPAPWSRCGAPHIPVVASLWWPIAFRDMGTREEEQAKQEILQWARDVDKMQKRHYLAAPEIQHGSRVQRDDTALQPNLLSYEVGQRINVAIDALAGVRAFSVRLPGDPGWQGAGADISLMTYAPSVLLRAAIENACSAAWLVETDADLTVRARRVFLSAFDTIRQRDNVYELLGLEARGWADHGGEEWLERMRALGVDVDAIVAKPRDHIPSTTSRTRAGARILAPGMKVRPEAIMAAWHSLSGLAHGEPWAARALVKFEPVEGADVDPESGRTTAAVHVPVDAFANQVRLATLCLSSVIRIYDRQRITMREHGNSSR